MCKDRLCDDCTEGRAGCRLKYLWRRVHRAEDLTLSAIVSCVTKLGAATEINGSCLSSWGGAHYAIRLLLDSITGEAIQVDCDCMDVEGRESTGWCEHTLAVRSRFAKVVGIKFVTKVLIGSVETRHEEFCNYIATDQSMVERPTLGGV